MNFTALLDWEILAELFLFASVATITPGPNNIFTFLHAVRSGFWTAMIFRLGVAVSFPLMVVLTLLGLSPVFNMYPVVLDVLTVVALAIMVYVAYQIWGSVPDLSGRDDGGERTLLVSGFWGAFMFQVINGKAWFMALSAIGLYTTPEQPIATQAFTLWFVFFVVNIPVGLLWIGGGLFLRTWLRESVVRIIIFNRIMAVLLVATPLFSL